MPITKDQLRAIKLKLGSSRVDNGLETYLRNIVIKSQCLNVVREEGENHPRFLVLMSKRMAPTQVHYGGRCTFGSGHAELEVSPRHIG